MYVGTIREYIFKNIAIEAGRAAGHGDI